MPRDYLLRRKDSSCSTLQLAHASVGSNLWDLFKLGFTLRKSHRHWTVAARYITQLDLVYATVLAQGGSLFTQLLTLCVVHQHDLRPVGCHLIIGVVT